MTYPPLFKGDVDDRLIEAVLEIIESMKPASMYGRHSPWSEKDPQEKSSVLASDFTFDMLGEHDFIGRVSWLIPRHLTASQLPLLLVEVTPDGIEITNPIVTFKNGERVSTKNLICLQEMVTSTRAFELSSQGHTVHLVGDTEELVAKCLEFLTAK